MYKVTVYHLQPSYRKGDLEEDETIMTCETFKTKKAAIAWSLSKVPNNHKIKKGIGTTPTYIYYYTKKKWINENTGETNTERFTYMITKI